MSDAQQTVTPISKLKPGQAYISGLISSRRRIKVTTGDIWLTVVKLPAADEFSHPGTLELRSGAPIGDVNDKWQGVVSITGFPRSYNTKPDSETGEIKTVRTAENHVVVVES